MNIATPLISEMPLISPIWIINLRVFRPKFQTLKGRVYRKNKVLYHMNKLFLIQLRTKAVFLDMRNMKEIATQLQAKIIKSNLKFFSAVGHK
jgi:hypothetical protein